MIIEIGRLCIKLAGRDAGRECLIVEKLKDSFVLIDGNTRRRKCNIHHLEFLSQKADIKKSASHDEVMKALGKLGIKALERRKKFPKKEKPKAAPKEEKKESILSKIVKKAAPKKEVKKAPTKKPKKKIAKK